MEKHEFERPATPEEIAAQRESAYMHGASRGERQAQPHQNCTCPLCMPHLWEAGIKGAGRPNPASEPERVSEERVEVLSQFECVGAHWELSSCHICERRAMARELRTLRVQLVDRDNHIATAYAALDGFLGCGCRVSRSIYLFDHIRKLKEELAEKNAAIEKAREDALSVPRWRIMELGPVNFLMERWGAGDWVKYDDVRRSLAAQKKEG